MDEAKKKVMDLSEKYHLSVDPDALITDITVGMQQRVEILKMLYKDNEILIFDEPTAMLTPQEIKELMKIMRGLVDEGKSLLFITHKLDEIKQVADRCTILRKGKYIDTVDVATTSKEKMSELMVGRKVQFKVDKKPAEPKDTVLQVEGLTVISKQGNKNVLSNVSFKARQGEILCIAGIDGNGPVGAGICAHRTYGPDSFRGRDKAQRTGYHPQYDTRAQPFGAVSHTRRQAQARAHTGLHTGV